MAIIGISGKIGSGKDTVGIIIQYLTDKSPFGFTHPDGFNDYMEYITSGHSSKSYWKIVKFADALKDIVCILTGCTKGQLEDNDFKNRYLNKEWNLDFSNDEPSKFNNYTYRQLLQQLGTNLFRNQLHENVWINALMSKYKLEGKVESEERCASDGGYYSTPNYKGHYPNLIITDVRFPNEAKSIKDRGGIIIRVNRDLVIGADDYGYTQVSVNKAEKDGIIKPQHYSETSLDNATFDYVVDNDSTIEYLIEKVKQILIKEKIL